MKERVKIAAMVIMALVIVTNEAMGDIIYVDDDANGANDGSSWADAFDYLQDALAVAQYDDEIRVAQGIYKPDQGVGVTPGDREATFQLINGVAIKGGYAGAGEIEPDARDIELYETILSGDLDGNDVEVSDPRELLDESTRAENSYHIVTGSGTDVTAVLDGFTITGGHANGSNINEHGAGMYNQSGSPTVRNCIFIMNAADYHAGGMCNRQDCNLILTNCSFIENYGSGVTNIDDCRLTLESCMFRENFSRIGGGMKNTDSSLILNNCTFIGNSAIMLGGGMEIYESDVTLKNCTFRGNSSQAIGGGIYSYEADAMLINCIFVDNFAVYDGGGMHNHRTSPTLMNCVFTGNWAGQLGGGIDNWLYSSPSLINCIFSGNLAEGGGAICSRRHSYPTLTNCILWGNAAIRGNNIYLAFYHWTGTYTAGIFVNYSDVEGGESGAYVETGCTLNWGEGNIDADPCFVFPKYLPPYPPPPPPSPPVSASNMSDIDKYIWTEYDYHLLEDSPCIDAGDPNYAAEPNEKDLDGKPRVIGGRIDMGVYEYGQLVPSEARIVPRTINPAGKGGWITAYLWLPEGFNIHDTECRILLLGYEIEPEQFHVNEEKQVVTAKFSREKIQTFLNAGEFELSISLHLMDGTVFEGRDVVRVIPEASGKPDKYVQASDPSPPDGATSVSVYTDLSWTASPSATSHDVYFGTSSPPTFVCNQIDTTFDPCTMAYDTTYYWRIDEVDKRGKTNGELWSFTTIKGPVPPPPPPP